MTSTMVSFTRCCTSMHDRLRKSRRLHQDCAAAYLLRAVQLLAVLAVLWTGISAARAENIEVVKTEAHYSDGNYHLSADFNINFNFVVDQALSRGIPLYFVSEFTLTRPRWYWLDEVVAQS